MKKRLLSCILFIVIIASSCVQHSTPQALKKKIESIIAGKKADIGVAIIGPEGSDSLFINNEKHYIIMSVVKFPEALTILHLVEQGKLSLTQNVHFDSTDLRRNTWSPLRDEHPDRKVDLPLVEVIKYAIQKSDNNACDKLFKLAGGPAEVQHYIHSTGADDIGIATDYAHMDTHGIQANWSTPSTMAHMLEDFYSKYTLNEKNRALLWEIMKGTITTPNRIKGLLPPGTIVGHKSGTMSADSTGIIPAINDAGIIQLPNGKHFTIVVFVNNTHEGEEGSAHIIAEIAKVSWDYFNGEGK